VVRQCHPLAEVAIKAVRSRRIKLHRAWIKTYYHWMENIRPWDHLRQLWWGHRIPAWYCDADGSVHVSRTDLSECPNAAARSAGSDVLDTWFPPDSGPSPRSAGPRRRPTSRRLSHDVLITGPDIIFFGSRA